MKIYWILFFIVSCTFNDDRKPTLNSDASSPKDFEENRNLIATDMANLNSRMRAKLIREEKYKDFSKLSVDEYLKKSKQYQNPSDREYMEYLSSNDLEIVVAGNEKVFSLCTKSLRMKLIFCDKADTAMPEFSGTDTSLDLNQKIKEFI